MKTKRKEYRQREKREGTKRETEKESRGKEREWRGGAKSQNQDLKKVQQ